MGQSGSSVLPHDKAMEDINRIRAQLRQLEEEYRFAGISKNESSKDLVRSLQQRFPSLRRWGSQESDSSYILLEAARAVINEAGVSPLMDVVDKIHALHGEMENISKFIAQELLHSPYDIFQVELDRCRRESELIIGEELSRYLVKVSEIDHLNQFLIKNIIQIFMVSFCESQWKPYFDKWHPHPAASGIHPQSPNLGNLKRQFLNQLSSLFKIAAWSIPGSKSRSAFEDSLTPFFKAMDETRKALENPNKNAELYLSVVGPDNDLSDSEVCVLDSNITTDSQRTPDEKLLREFAQGHIVGTFGIGIYCSMQDGNGVSQFRNLLRKKVIISSAIVDQILPPYTRPHYHYPDGRDPSPPRGPPRELRFVTFGDRGGG